MADGSGAAWSDLASRLRAELTRLGRWSPDPPDPSLLHDAGAFGHRTMAPEQWLQYVLVERLVEVAAGRIPPPADSAVSVWAVRAFDGDPDADALVAILADLDAAVADLDR